MALTLAQAFLTGVRTTLLDPNAMYWSDATLIGFYNLFVTVAIGVKPDALTKEVTFALSPGVIQTIPTTDGVMFLSAPANVTGQGITEVNGDDMAYADPNWYSQPPSPLVRHVIPDPRDPLKFRVWPPNDGTGNILLDYSYAPPDAVLSTDTFLLTEAYREPARNAVLAMAYAISTDRQDLNKSQYYYSLLDARLDMKTRAQQQFMPIVDRANQTTE